MKKRIKLFFMEKNEAKICGFAAVKKGRSISSLFVQIRP